MTPPSAGPHEPVQYELRVAEQLHQRWATWFDGFALAHDADGTTLSGPVADQAALHVLLRKIRDLGTTLVSVRVIDHPSH